MGRVRNYFKPQFREPQAGDIIGFLGTYTSSIGISLGTYGWPFWPFWSLSHIGFLANDADGKLKLFESIHNGDTPCDLQGKCFSGTQCHSLESQVSAYQGRIWHYPLTRPLYDFESERLTQFALDTVGIPYDQIGAFRAGGIGWSWLESRFHDSCLSSIFCSEWCVAAHTHIGIFQTDNVSRWSPNYFARTERRQGILLGPRRLK